MSCTVTTTNDGSRAGVSEERALLPKHVLLDDTTACDPVACLDGLLAFELDGDELDRALRACDDDPRLVREDDGSRRGARRRTPSRSRLRESCTSGSAQGGGQERPGRPYRNLRYREGTLSRYVGTMGLLIWV